MASSSSPVQSFGRRGVTAAPAASKPNQARPAAAVAAVSPDMVLAFVDRNKHKFEPTVEAMARADAGFGSWSWGWSWAGFFVPVVWLAYRKMWIQAAVLYFALLALGYVLGEKSAGTFVVYLLMGMMAKSFYVKHAVASIRRIIAAEPNPAKAAVVIRDAGGVSVGSAWIAIILMVLPAVYLVMKIAAAASAAD